MSEHCRGTHGSEQVDLYTVFARFKRAPSLFAKSSLQICERVTIGRKTEIGFKASSSITVDMNSSQNPTQCDPKQSVSITLVNFGVPIPQWAHLNQLFHLYSIFLNFLFSLSFFLNLNG